MLLSQSKHMIKQLIIFLVLNFGALAIGGLSTNAAVTGEWYLDLNKAPWTPPGWVFGFSWTVIMICFSIFMAFAWEAVKDRKTLITLYVIQLILNIGWNPIFFNLKMVVLGLVVISSLTLLIFTFFGKYRKEVGGKVYLLVPYMLWLVIATSLNAYVLLYN